MAGFQRQVYLQEDQGRLLSGQIFAASNLPLVEKEKGNILPFFFFVFLMRR